MSTRTISTRLAIEGEAQYKSALTGINAEIRKLKTALKDTENAFKGQANSVEALRAKDETLNKVYEAQSKKVSEISKAFPPA